MPPKREWPASKVSEYITPIATYAAPSELPRTTSKSRVFAVSSYGESTGKEKSIVVGGEWYFKPNGVAAVKTRFFKQLEKLGLAQVSNYAFFNFPKYRKCFCPGVILHQLLPRYLFSSPLESRAFTHRTARTQY